VDGFPWAVFRQDGKIINSKENVTIQESEFDIMSALLLVDYFNQFL
jgi:DNA-binding winged helix-turn-helix (wHTH) protein